MWSLSFFLVFLATGFKVSANFVNGFIVINVNVSVVSDFVGRFRVI